MDASNDSPPDEAPDATEMLTTGDMARLTGNTLRTVRFYEEAGIVRPERRSTGGHRLFSHFELDRLRLITNLRAAGLSLEEIRVMLELKERSASAASGSSALVDAVERQIATLDERIEALAGLRDELLATRSAMSDCQACTEDGFPEACGSCSKLSARELPKTMRVLWALRPSGDG